MLINVFLISGAALLQAKDYKESVYIVRTGSVEVNTESTVLDCQAALDRARTNYGVWFPGAPGVPGPAYTTASANYYSVQTKGSNGKVVNDSVKKVGSLLTCQDFSTWPEVGLLYVINIDGKTLMAHGGSQMDFGPVNPWLGGANLMAYQFGSPPAYGYPVAGVYLFNNSLTILPSIVAGLPLPDGSIASPSQGGTVTVNAVLDSLGQEDEFESTGLHVIRLFTPCNDVCKAKDQFLESFGGFQ